MAGHRRRNCLGQLRVLGILRQHIITHTGRYRDTAYFSILDSEWPEVKLALEERLGG